MVLTQSKRLSVKFNTGKGSNWGFSVSNLVDGLNADTAKKAMERLITDGTLWADPLKSVKSLQMVTRSVEDWLED